LTIYEKKRSKVYYRATKITILGIVISLCTALYGQQERYFQNIHLRDFMINFNSLAELKMKVNDAGYVSSKYELVAR
jgi:hypothetical protein